MSGLYSVVYRKLQHKKNKTWENDGFIKVQNGQTILLGQNLEIVQTKNSMISIEIGLECRIGNYEVLMEDVLDSLPIKADATVIPIKENSSLGNLPGIKKPPTNSFKLHPNKKFKPLLQRPRVQEFKIDAFLDKQLRVHQREGVEFLIKSIMGNQKFKGQGCILADEMGLGKSIQAITLIWLVIKQLSQVKRTILVCPVSLVGNWNQEFKKWLGMSRMSIFTVEANTTSIAEFFIGRKYSVMIMGYEKLHKFKSEILDSQIDLVVCDEGHRLKNKNTIPSEILNHIKTKRRIILTGTPVQNNLEEFVELINFVNPGTLLYSKSELERLEDSVISSIKEKTQDMVLRRSSKVNEKYLMSKSEYYVFCNMSNEQKLEYKSIIENKASNCLSSITQLQKVANCIPTRKDLNVKEFSSKYFVVQQLLNEIHSQGEKFVLFSQSTSTLDLFSDYCTSLNWEYVRLDGSTLEKNRQDYVNKFNGNSKIVGFLTSTKAGGVGINLVAASKLIMLDISWNPAHDVQATARVWRDGQLKPVTIYRFFSAGTIEEKVLYRQFQKLNLSDAMNDGTESDQVRIDKEEYDSLVAYDFDTSSIFHDLLDCQECNPNNHLKPPFAQLREPFLDAAILNSGSIVSFVMLK